LRGLLFAEPVVRIRHGVEQRACIIMDRAAENVGARPAFHNLAGIDNGDIVGHARNQPKIMRDV